MAPEVKSDEYDPFYADIYSMGLVLYELFNYLLPEWDQFEELAFIPRDFYIGKALISQCIEHDPTQRPTSVEILQFLDNWVAKIMEKVKEDHPDLLNNLNINNEDTNDDNYMVSLYNFLIFKFGDNEAVDKMLLEFGESFFYL